jgi:predicted Zn-dependent protease
MKKARIFAVGALTVGLIFPAAVALCDTPKPPAPPASAASAPAAPPMSDKDRKEMQSEQKQGGDIAASIEKEGKLSKDQALIDRVNTIGQKIAAIANTVQIPAMYGNNKVYPFTWTFHVVNDKDVNAFSLPGGYVYVNSGLLKLVASDDELAGVLAHEITHAAHHHIAMMAHQANHLNTELAIGMIAAALAHASGQDLSNLYAGASLYTQGVMNNHYGEDAERDADHGGVIYMQKAGYNPIGMLTFMEKLKDLEHRSVNQVEGTIFQDHPYTDERVGNIEAQLASMGVKPTSTAMYVLSTKSDHFTTASTGKMQQIKFDDTICATIYDPDGTRAAALLKTLNGAVDQGLPFSSVNATQDTVTIDNRPWLKVLPADLIGSTEPDAQTAAKDIAHSVQKVLYNRTFLSFNTADATDGPAKKHK